MNKKLAILLIITLIAVLFAGCIQERYTTPAAAKSTQTPAKPCVIPQGRGGSYWLNYCNNEPPITHTCQIIGPQATERVTPCPVNVSVATVEQSTTPSLMTITSANYAP